MCLLIYITSAYFISVNTHVGHAQSEIIGRFSTDICRKISTLWFLLYLFDNETDISLQRMTDENST